jgi:hypothetical protein
LISPKLKIRDSPGDELIHEAVGESKNSKCGDQLVLRVHDLNESERVPQSPLFSDVMTDVLVSVRISSEVARFP